MQAGAGAALTALMPYSISPPAALPSIASGVPPITLPQRITQLNYCSLDFKQTDRQTDKQTERQTDMQMNGQRD